MKQKIKSVGVRVNGKEIELNDFVETIFGNTIMVCLVLAAGPTPKLIEVCVETQPAEREN